MPIALTVMIHITVHYLLLLACARLSRHVPELIRFLLAAVVGENGKDQRSLQEN